MQGFAQTIMLSCILLDGMTGFVSRLIAHTQRMYFERKKVKIDNAIAVKKIIIL